MKKTELLANLCCIFLLCVYTLEVANTLYKSVKNLQFMTPDQHKAEMITLHTNLMDAQSKVKKDIKILSKKRDLISRQYGGVATMNDSQKRNYEMFCDLIEHANTHLLISQAVISKHQDLFNRQVEFIKKYQTPFFRIAFIKHLSDNLSGFIESEIAKSQLDESLIKQH